MGSNRVALASRADSQGFKQGSLLLITPEGASGMLTNRAAAPFATSGIVLATLPTDTVPNELLSSQLHSSQPNAMPRQHRK
jgi:hypothetical protein